MSSEAALGKSPEAAIYDCSARKANNVNPVFPSIVHHLDIPRMKIVAIQSQDNEILLD
jgi:hypothetical protein